MVAPVGILRDSFGCRNPPCELPVPGCILGMVDHEQVYGELARDAAKWTWLVFCNHCHYGHRRLGSINFLHDLVRGGVTHGVHGVTNLPWAVMLQAFGLFFVTNATKN